MASVAGILHGRLVAGDAPPFLDLLGPLAGVVLAPYRDAQTVAGAVERAQLLACALAEERSTQPPRPGAGVAIPNGLSSPAAYRRRQCLLYLTGHPGASNRAVAEGIGIIHRGQTSKLLARLAGWGLVSKRAGGPGHANAWSLTPHGELVAQALKDAQ